MGHPTAGVRARHNLQGVFQRLSADYPMLATSTIVDALAQVRRPITSCVEPGTWAVVEAAARHNLDLVRGAYRERSELPEPAPAARTFDDDLLAAAARGDQGAFAMLYDRTAPVIYGLLHEALGERILAADVTARIYLRLWRTAARADRSVYCLLLAAAGAEITRSRLTCEGI